MFYIALLLIISGILIFVYSVFHKSIEGDGIRKRLAFFTKKKVPVSEIYTRDETEKVRVPERIFQEDQESRDVIVKELPGRGPHTESSREKPGGDHPEPLRGSDTEVIRDEDIIIADTYDDRKPHDETAQRDVPAGAVAGESREEGERVPVNAVETVKKEKEGDTGDFVLYDDSSSIINYTSSTGFIDPTLEEYRKIRRVGRGNVLLDRDGVSFYLGKKLFRFDFHRLKEIVTGGNFIALFVNGSDTVKLFIADRENDLIRKIGEKFAEYSSHAIHS